MVWSLSLARLEPTALNCRLTVNPVLLAHTAMVELAAACPVPQVTTAMIQLWGHYSVSLDMYQVVEKLLVLFVQVVSGIHDTSTSTCIIIFYVVGNLSLSLSLAHIHTYTYTYTRTLSHSFSPTRPYTTFIGMMPDAFQSICINCPAGYYCSDPRQPPQSCQTGTYSLSGANTECTVCPAGYSCSFTNSLPQLCASGSYSPLASTECDLCPAGSSCPQNISFPEPCLSGEFSQEGGKMMMLLYLHKIHLFCWCKQTCMRVCVCTYLLQNNIPYLI